MRGRAVWGSVLLCLSGTVGAHQIAPGIAENTVHDFAELFGLSVLYKSNRLVPYHTHAVDSDDPIKALHQLLDGTGLTFSFLNPRVISVDPVEAPEMVMVIVLPKRVAKSRSRTQPAVQRGTCDCAQTFTAQGWIDGPWCRYEDGLEQYVPDRCPLPDPYRSH